MDSNALETSVGWIAGVLTGTVGTSVAIIAVALCGYQMLSGRIPLQRMIQVVIGCVLIFGAHIIATGLMTGLTGSAPPPGETAPPMAVPAAPALRTEPQTSYDPYAGAAVPQSPR